MTIKKKKYYKKRRRYNKKKIVLLILIILTICNVSSIILWSLALKIKDLSLDNKTNQKNYAEKQMYVNSVNEVGKRKRVLIDPGHGGSDQGTYNPRNGTIEKGITIEIANKVAYELSKDKNLQVIQTRTMDKSVSLSERNEIGINNNVDLFISIHCNASNDGSSTAQGIETFYWNKDNGSYDLAKSVHDNLLYNSGAKDRGVKKGNYKVLRDSNVPSILIETGFLTNDNEENKLLDSQYQEILAKSIANGIREYIKTN